MRTSLPRLLLVIVILGLPVVALVLVASEDTPPLPPEQCADERAALKKLRPMVKEYAALAGSPVSEPPPVDGVVVIARGRIDEDVYCRLPQGLQARSPEDVRTVVLVDYQDRRVGRYTTGGRAIQTFAAVTLVNLAADERYRRSARFVGPAPPTVVERIAGSHGNEYGGDPTGKIREYLERLAAGPRR